MEYCDWARIAKKYICTSLWKRRRKKGTLICCLPFVCGNEFYVHSEIVNNVNAPNVNKNIYISL